VLQSVSGNPQKVFLFYRRKIMADKIAVLIPCYNESKTVAKVIRDMKKALPEAVIYVYDNNSTDGTDEIARKEGLSVMSISREKET